MAIYFYLPKEMKIFGTQFASAVSPSADTNRTTCSESNFNPFMLPQGINSIQLVMGDTSPLSG